LGESWLTSSHRRSQDKLVARIIFNHQLSNSKHQNFNLKRKRSHFKPQCSRFKQGHSHLKQEHSHLKRKRSRLKQERSHLQQQNLSTELGVFHFKQKHPDSEVKVSS
jgi:hypothetical protein